MSSDVALLLLAVAILVVGTPVAAAPERGEPLLDTWYEGWFGGVAPLFTEREARVWSELDDDLERELFIDGFWRARGATAVERYRDNLAALRELRVLSEERARAVLLAGKPARVVEYDGCGDRLRRLEIWHWDRWHVERQSAASRVAAVNLLFVQTSNLDQHSWRAWSWQSGEDVLLFDDRDELSSLLDAEVTRDCLGPERARLLRQVASDPVALAELVELVPWPEPDPDWLDRLAERLAERSPPLAEAEVEMQSTGSYGELTVVEGTVSLGVEALHRDPAGQLFDRVTLLVDVYRRSRWVGSGRVTHLLSGPAPVDGTVELSFLRRLRPGLHTFDLRVGDAAERPLLRRLVRFEVATAEAESAAGRSAAEVARSTRDEVVVLTTFPRLELSRPRPLDTGELEVEAMTAGGPIEAVEFGWRGEPLIRDDEPPYAARIAPSAAAGTLEARALGPGGEVLVSASRRLSAVPESFGVEIGAVVPGETGSVAPVRVAVPAGRQLRSLTCFLDERPVLSTTEPTASCPVPDRAVDLAWLRAVAVLDDGERREEVLIVSRRPQERVDVELREILVTVHDERGRPVAGLEAGDFLLRESGEPRPLEGFAIGDPMPLHLAVLIDTSSSMGRRVRQEGEATSRFFSRVLGADDRAALFAFNHDVRRLAAFTADPRSLEYGVRGVRAWGSTRLWDGIVFALHQYRGQGERRALVVLSDGADVESEFGLRGVVEAARQAGVAVYPVALAVDDSTHQRELEELASATAGTFFEARGVQQLDSVYLRIEALLRSRYRLSYRPLADAEAEVEVEVRRPGVEVRRVGLAGDPP